MQIPGALRRILFSFPDHRLHVHQRAVDRAPEHKGPACAVPETRAEEYNPLVADGLCFAFPVAAERNVEIFTEPCGQRNMPAPPEFSNRGGAVRIIEVFRECESEQPPHADCHIAVTGKIIVDLKRIAECAEPCRRECQRIRHAEYRIRNQPDRVRNQQLFRKPEDHSADAGCCLLRCGAACGQSVLNGLITHNRSCNQLREECDIKQQAEVIALRFCFVSGHIHDIRDGLKHKKGNADRQTESQHRE